MKKDEKKGKVGSDGDLPVKGSMVWWEVLWFGKWKAYALFYSCSQQSRLQASCFTSLCQIFLIYQAIIKISQFKHYDDL